MKNSSKSGKASPPKIIGPWEDEEWWFKRPQKTLEREELCSQVQRQLNYEENTSTCEYNMKTEKQCTKTHRRTTRSMKRLKVIH